MFVETNRLSFRLLYFIVNTSLYLAPFRDQSRRLSPLLCRSRDSGGPSSSDRGRGRSGGHAEFTGVTREDRGLILWFLVRASRVKTRAIVILRASTLFGLGLRVDLFCFVRYFYSISFALIHLKACKTCVTSNSVRLIRFRKLIRSEINLVLKHVSVNPSFSP